MTPTATQLRADAHDTPVSAPGSLLGVGIGCSDQIEPFHRSARVAPTAEEPTAVQAFTVGHDTALRSPPRAPRGLGVG
jgi:hypothetical protein